jgi:hypothetical protein
VAQKSGPASAKSQDEHTPDHPAVISDSGGEGRIEGRKWGMLQIHLSDKKCYVGLILQVEGMLHIEQQSGGRNAGQ